MWFEERSWSLNQMKMSSLIVEEWRDIWSYKVEFMLIGWAYVFATTNLLNFPRLVLENGGLAFLAAYGAVLLIVILPVLVLELTVGQLTGRAPMQALYNICPTFKGVGVSQLIFSLFVLACMTRYLAWIFLYIFYLFWSVIDDRPGLPWLHCKSFPEFQLMECLESASIRTIHSDDDSNLMATTTTQIITTTIPSTTTTTISPFDIITTTAIDSLMESMTTSSSIIDEILTSNTTIVATAAGFADELAANLTQVADALANNLSAIASALDANVSAALGGATAAALLGESAQLEGRVGIAPALADNRLNVFHPNSALSQFVKHLEDPSGSIADVGEFRVLLVSAQCAVWLIVFCAICFGVRWLGKVGAAGIIAQSIPPGHDNAAIIRDYAATATVSWAMGFVERGGSGQVVMFTFLVPFLLLVALTIRCAFLSNALDAFSTFVWAPTDWHRLEDYMMWKTAAEQAILATGIGFGAFITIGSYNKHSNNLIKDSVLLVLGHAVLTALQFCFLIALVGYVSSRTGLPIGSLLEIGENQMWQLLTYLAFVPHTRILSGALLVLCALCLLNVFFLLSLSILASLEDGLGERWTRCCRRFMLALFVALLGAALSLYFATQAGRYAYELAIGFLKYITLEVILACELLAVSWFYCAHSLGMDLRTMLASGVAWCMGYFLLIFTYFLPAVPIAIAVANLYAYSFDGTYSKQVRNWTPWSQIIGITIAIVPLLPIPLCAIRAIWRTCRYPSEATKFQRLRHAFRSPMHYDLVGGKSGTESGSLAGEEGGSGGARGNAGPRSPHYSAAAPGYVLLPQHATPAPLAQPEHYYATGAAVSTTTTTASATRN